MSAIWIILSLFVAWMAVLLIRAVRFTEAIAPTPAVDDIPVDEAEAAGRLQAMIQKRTVSHVDTQKIDQKEFDAFQELLPTLYPVIHGHCKRERIGKNGLLYTWKGKSSAAPSVLMAHYDVVPVNEKEWQEPPFSGIIKDGEIWGRGALDTKCTLHGILEAAELLLKKGFSPANDIYFAFGGDEEIMGDDAPSIVAELQRRGIKPSFVLDEGGAIVKNVFPGVKQSAAVVGIAEKGSAFVDICAVGKGGHASAPPTQQSMDTLAKAIRRLQKKPMPFTLTKPARELFEVMGRQSTFAFKLIFANLWCFKPLLNLVCKKSGGELNALVRTTCAFTMASAAEAYNILPKEAVAGVNLRIICGETLKQVVARMEKTIGDENVTLRVQQGVEPSAISKTHDEAWNRLDTAIRQTYPEVLVTPYLMVAASDSRHYCQISEHVFRFCGIPLSKEQLGLIHNANERIPVALLKDAIGFFARVMQLS